MPATQFHRRRHVWLPFLAVGAAFVAASQLPSKPAVAAAEPAPTLFEPIATVLRHPRCMNCHPRSERPRQGNDEHLHMPAVVRGLDDMGFVNMRCPACHRDENNKFTGVPGAPNWRLAPLSMGWKGLNDTDLCDALKDESKNGGKNVAQLVAHMSHDELVLWGWKPGGKRQPVSIPHAEFVKDLKAWAAAGAPCPTTAN